MKDKAALQLAVTSLQDQLAVATAQPSRPDPSLCRLELEQTLSTRLQQADRLILENQQLVSELATRTSPARNLSRALRDYVTTKHHDLEAALANHHADFQRQQRWLIRFEERDPDFQPWLMDDDASLVAKPTSAPPTA